MEALVRKRSRDASKPDTELLLQLDLHKLHFMMIPTKESGGMSASTTPTKPPSNTRKNSGLLGNAMMMMMMDSPTKGNSSSKRKVIRLEVPTIHIHTDNYLYVLVYDLQISIYLS